MSMTVRQAELLHFLKKYQRENLGASPSLTEMGDVLGLKGKAGVHRLLTGLEERGFIERKPHMARAIRVLPDLDIETAILLLTNHGYSVAKHGKGNLHG